MELENLVGDAEQGNPESDGVRRNRNGFVDKLKVLFVALVAVVFNMITLTQYFVSLEYGTMANPIVYHIIRIVYFLFSTLVMYRAFYYSGYFIPHTDQSRHSVSGLDYIVILCVAFFSIQMLLHMIACIIFMLDGSKSAEEIARALLHFLWLAIDTHEIFFSRRP